MELRRFVHVDDDSKVIEIANTQFADVQADAILSVVGEDGRKLYKEVTEKKKAK